MIVSEEYKKKIISAEESAKLINNGEKIYVSSNASVPLALLRALANRIDKPKGVQILHFCMLKSEPTTEKCFEEYFRHNSLFVGPDDRQAVNEGRADYVPVHLHDIPRLIATGALSVDTVFTQTSPPDRHGFLSLGTEVGATKSAIKKAKRVIVQVNENMPRVLGNSFIHLSQIHYIIEHNEPLVELIPEPYTDVERRIAHYVNELIEDGSTLQAGIGAIPNAVMDLLEGRKDLGIHTEIMSDGIMQAIEKGIITGSAKSIHKGKVITTFVVGTKKLYQFVNDNPFIEAHPVHYTNDPFVISQNDKMVAINSAIEVDITGQVCADSMGTLIYSGFGGQLDFIRGAAASVNGKPIIALPSTAQNGKVSRIVPFLKPGAGVVTTRADVHYVITEYGIASLNGKNLRERAKNLISIAHPKFREELEKSAFERKLLQRSFFIEHK